MTVWTFVVFFGVAFGASLTAWGFGMLTRRGGQALAKSDLARIGTYLHHGDSGDPSAKDKTEHVVPLNWADVYAPMFGQVFGSRLFGLRRLAMTLILTGVGPAVTACVLMISTGEHGWADSRLFLQQDLPLPLVVTAIAHTLVPMFVTLWLTGEIVQWLTARQQPRWTIVGMSAAALGPIAIWVAYVLVITLSAYLRGQSATGELSAMTGIPPLWTAMPDGILDFFGGNAVQISPSWVLLSASVYALFAAPAWLIVFALSWGVLRIVGRFGDHVYLSGQKISILTDPLRALTYTDQFLVVLFFGTVFLWFD